MSEVVIYKSSAGSGKTFTLALNYLKLALKYPNRYRQILAVTFTNKATGEMKTRIIENLNKLSKGKEPLLEKLLLNAGIAPDAATLKQRASDVLQQILHDYTRFNISTIDSFFQKVIRSFAREAGLHAGYQVELDDSVVLSEAVDKLITLVGKDKVLTNWLIKFAEDKVEDGENFDFRKDILELGTQIFKEDYKSIEPEIIHLLNDPEFIKSYQDELRVMLNGIGKRRIQLAKDGVALIEQYGLNVDDFKLKDKGGLGSFFYALSEDKPKNATKTILSALDSVENCYTKGTLPGVKARIEDAYNNGLRQLLEDLIDQQADDLFLADSLNAVLSHYYTFGILSYISTMVSEIRKEKDLLLLSDAAQLLGQVIDQNDAPFIYEKTGTAYKNFLVDEFQDTSGFQWNNMKPLVLNSLAEGNQNLVVGDVKQSIYRWRGGNWKLLLSQIEEDLPKEQTRIENLNTNYRSCKNIILFNNTLFTLCPPMLKSHFDADVTDTLSAGALQNELLQKSEDIIKAYDDAIQIPNSNEGGYVEVKWINGEEGDPEEDEENGLFNLDKVSGEVVRIIDELFEKGYRPGDIAILVRKRAEGLKIANDILTYASTAFNPERYKILSDESLYLSNSHAVGLLIDAIRLIYIPQDKVARAALIQKYYQHFHLRNEAGSKPNFSSHPWLKLAGKVSDSTKKDVYYSLLPAAYRDRLPQLGQLPLFELVEELIRIFKLHEESSDHIYLQAFQDEVLEYSRNDQPDLASFLSWWSDKGSSKSVCIPEGVDAIRIMTIHKAKGLEFGAVILPFFNWKIDAAIPGIIWCRSDRPPFDKVPYLPVKYGKGLAKTVFARDYYMEKLQNFIDSLNIVYVALTRPVQSLFILAKMPKKDELTTVSNLMMRVAEIKNFTGDELRFNGLNDFCEVIGFDLLMKIGTLEPPKDEKHKIPQPEVKYKSYPSQSWRERISIREMSKKYFGQEGFASTAAIDRGVTMHNILSTLTHKKDIPRQVQALVFEGIIASEEQEQYEQALEQLLVDEKISRYFGDDWQVKLESAILLPDGTFCQPDRVLISGKKAIVIDYKFGEERKYHEKQVKQYVELLKQMGYDDVNCLLIYFKPEALFAIENVKEVQA